MAARSRNQIKKFVDTDTAFKCFKDVLCKVTSFDCYNVIHLTLQHCDDRSVKPKHVIYREQNLHSLRMIVYTFLCQSQAPFCTFTCFLDLARLDPMRDGFDSWVAHRTVRSAVIAGTTRTVTSTLLQSLESLFVYPMFSKPRIQISAFWNRHDCALLGIGEVQQIRVTSVILKE